MLFSYVWETIGWTSCTYYIHITCQDCSREPSIGREAQLLPTKWLRRLRQVDGVSVQRFIQSFPHRSDCTVCICSTDALLSSMLEKHMTNRCWIWQGIETAVGYGGGVSLKYDIFIYRVGWWESFSKSPWRCWCGLPWSMGPAKSAICEHGDYLELPLTMNRLSGIVVKWL